MFTIFLFWVFIAWLVGAVVAVIVMYRISRHYDYYYNPPMYTPKEYAHGFIGSWFTVAVITGLINK